MPIDKMPLPFTVEEYRSRVAHLRNEMVKLGADHFLVTDPANIFYLSGFSMSGAYVPQALLVLADEVDPALFLRKLDLPVALYMAYMAEDRIIAYPESLIGNPDRSGYDYMFDWIKGRPALKSIGAEFDALSGATLDSIRASRRAGQLLDLSGAIMQQRLVKSAAEIAVLREAAILTDKAMMVAQAELKPGAEEPAVAASIVAALIAGRDGLWGWPATGISMPGGSLVGASHIDWTGSTVRPGSHYNVELGAARFRYAAPLMRTISIGKPPPRLDHMHGYMLEGCEDTLAMIRPGVTTGEIAATYCRALARGGYEKETRCGYPIGIDWVESSCSIQTGDTTFLKPGMAFHLMLGNWPTAEFGAVLSESIIVTETGCEVLSKVSRQILVS